MNDVEMSANGVLVFLTFGARGWWVVSLTSHPP